MPASPDGRLQDGDAFALSVIVFVRERLDLLSETLGSLPHSEGLERVQVLVVDGSEGGASSSILSDFPSARHIRRPGQTMPVLKREGLLAAKADVVAVLDAGARVASEWLTEIEAGLRDESAAAIGGAVLLDPRADAVERALYLFEYGAFNLPLAGGVTAGDLPGTNVAYRRAFLLEAGRDVLAEMGFNKPFLHEALRRHGGQLRVHPHMLVRKRAPQELRHVIRRRFHYGRCFGANRRHRATWPRKLLLIASAPLVPLLLIGRHLRRHGRHPGNRTLLRGSRGPLAAICLSWGLGEWLGCWLGAGRSCERLY